jgi:hypothetical protein
MNGCIYAPVRPAVNPAAVTSLKTGMPPNITTAADTLSQHQPNPENVGFGATGTGSLPNGKYHWLHRTITIFSFQP